MNLMKRLNECRKEQHLAQQLSGIPILTYHKIDARQEIGINTLSPERLQQHLQLLKEWGYQTLTFNDLLDTSPLPEKPLIITFDDAYESVYQQALPLFRDFGFTAVVFVIAGYINRWNDWDANLGGIRFQHMSEEQLQGLEECGWEIGAHTMTHRALTHLGNRILEYEVERSRQLLENITRRPVISFAYPFGMQNSKVRQQVKASGFYFGCQGVRGFKASDLLQLPRIPVYQFERGAALKRKLRVPALRLFEHLKLGILSSPARLTPIYQKFFKAHLFLEK